MKNMKRITINNTEIGDGLPAQMIAEIGLNHNGSVELGHRMIDAAAESGATMVKFQKRTPDALAVADFLDAPFEKCPTLGRTQRHVREKLELTLDEHKALRDHANDLGMIWFASIFDIPGLQLAEALDMPVIKIASHSLTNGPLLEAVAATGRPVMLSVGGTSWEERDQAVRILDKNPLLLFHCVSSYPTPDNQVKLDTIDVLKQRYNLPVGFSGHEVGTIVSMAAIAKGACVVERHFTLNRSMPGLDHGISLEPHEFAELSMAAKRIAAASGVSGDVLEAEMAARTNYHVAVRAAVALEKGHVISAEDLVCKQPLKDSGEFFTGLEYRNLVGKTLNRALAVEEAIARVDLD
ncbi:N-acetylneuraminate synthase family protein [Kordiimonas sp. SCSIO 12603]|uniref:N-acetylneuraminate synthase family protein n=1 Tax=Kordiimonas sp. SCSIO 12603 TaxID=2829596 RepID=UPI002102BB4C|nr:N-acetylneuraminate synthase family protein [Kordiimonas sp. SCSIO 12603]UTW57622.1 N-acetylneuraminate synthase family protein [Kordiimonas sp. SCSIO 12603]